MQLISSADRRARDKAVKVIVEEFKKLVEQINRGESPTIILPKRTLSNTIYDGDRKLLLLGPEKMSRTFLDVREAKKFMQTVLMARIIYEALINNEYPTIRDLFYRGKHTIRYRSARGRVENENTWDEQKESDSVIRDIEVFINLLREELLILSKEKGKVVGNMKIRSGDDAIDLSKMGHGAYSIEPTPDLIEFLDVDAEYVLIVEKDAVFQQLHRAGFWRKYKTLLITSAGQPDRATRRFVRRLNDELKLPTYIITDSIPGDEVVIIRDPKTGEVRIGPIEELVGHHFTRSEIERVFIDLEVPAWNPHSGKIEWRRVGYVYRHRIDGKLLRIRTKGRGTVRVTGGHSLFVVRNGVITVLPAKDLMPHDSLLVASKLPYTPSVSIESEHGTSVKFSSGGLTPTYFDEGVAPYEPLETLHGPLVHLAVTSKPLSAAVAYEGTPSPPIYVDHVKGYSIEVEDGVKAKQLFNNLLFSGITPRGVEEYEGFVRIALPSPGELSSETPPAKDVSLVEVIDVSEEDYAGYVYDFMVPECNSFVGSYGFIFHNSDPYGWYIYSVFKIGSITLSYESERLATPGLRFLGVMPSDIFGDPNIKKAPYLSESERRNFIIKAKERDIKRAKELINYKWFQTPRWRSEIVDIFLKKESKLEIEALTSKGLKFLMDEYIPKKLELKDWID